VLLYGGITIPVALVTLKVMVSEPVLVVPSIIRKGLRISAAPPGEDPEPACSAISKTLLDPPVVP